jgi:ABC-2 type transport system ATP-binding protein
VIEGLSRFGERQPASRNEIAVRFDNGGDLSDVVRALDEAGVKIAHLDLHEPTLDDVFLTKTGRSLEGSGGAAEEPEPEPVAS